MLIYYNILLIFIYFCFCLAWSWLLGDRTYANPNPGGKDRNKHKARATFSPVFTFCRDLAHLDPEGWDPLKDPAPEVSWHRPLCWLFKTCLGAGSCFPMGWGIVCVCVLKLHLKVILIN